MMNYNYVRYFIIILWIFLLIPCKTFAAEYLYILDDKCINDLFFEAEKFFKDTEIRPIRDSRGLILRFEVMNILDEYLDLSIESYKKIEYFLAKIENPAIIEVHIGNFPDGELGKLKKWEVSTIMANNIEAVITKPFGTIEQNRINSIGYGEFLPAKNPPNNGGKDSNRVDIIILCSITGE